MNSQIKTIVFDLGGVLYDLDRERCVSALNKLGLSNADEMLGNYKQSGVFQQLEEGTITTTHFYDSIRKLIGNEVSDAQIKNAWDAFLVEIPDYKLEMLSELKNRFKILMLSNTNAIHFADEIPHAFTKQGKQISDYFDKCYLSYEMNCSKPHVEIFEKMVADARILPTETLFIDDSPANIQTAQSLGFKTYLAKPFEDFTHIFEEMTI